MSALQLDTDEDPKRYARLLCEWIRDNPERGPLTIREIMITFLEMHDPLSRKACASEFIKLVAPGAEFAHLREQGLFAVSKKESAKKLGLPYRPLARLPVVNRMKWMDRQRETLTRRQHLPEPIKERMGLVLDGIEQGTGRYCSGARAWEQTENMRELGASASSEFRVLNTLVAEKDARIAYLEDALLAALSGGRSLPPPQGEPA
jgi:hypothetical protein